MKDFYAWFSGVSSVKALISKYSPPPWRDLPFVCWFSGGFPVWRLTLSTLHKRSPPVWMLCSPCEHFDFKTFTLETVENQKKTSIAWIGEYFFREIKYVYIRAQREPSPNRLELFQRDYSASSAQPHAAWRSLHKSSTISHKSLSRQNKSLSWQNKSRTCGSNSRTCGRKQFRKQFI